MIYYIGIMPVGNDELYHYGIKGMRWGQRRYQNPDGSYTAAGRQRYGFANRFGKRAVSMGRKINKWYGRNEKKIKRAAKTAAVVGAAAGTAYLGAKYGKRAFSAAKRAVRGTPGLTRYNPSVNRKARIRGIVDDAFKGAKANQRSAKKGVREAIRRKRNLVEANKRGDKAVKKLRNLDGRWVAYDTEEAMRKRRIKAERAAGNKKKLKKAFGKFKSAKNRLDASEAAQYGIAAGRVAGSLAVYKGAKKRGTSSSRAVGRASAVLSGGIGGYLGFRGGEALYDWSRKKYGYLPGYEPTEAEAQKSLARARRQKEQARKKRKKNRK